MWNPFKKRDRRLLELDVPRGLTVELTSHCMYDCQPCPLNFYTEPVKRQHLDLNFLEKRLKELPALATIDLTGWGEALLHPDIERAVRLATRSASEVSMTTAGLLLDRERSDILIGHGVSYVMVSLDAADRAGYLSLKHKDDFDKVVGNIEAFLGERSRKGRSRPHIALSCILMRETLPHWYPLAELAAAMQVDQLVYKALVPMSPESLRSSLHHNFYPSVEPPALDPSEELDRAIGYATGKGIEVAVFNEWGEPSTHACMAFGEQRPYLRADGQLAPCCMLAYPLERPLRDGTSLKIPPRFYGNWFSEPLEFIWQKPDYVRFREQLGAKAPDAVCRDCPVNHIFRLSVHAPDPVTI